MTIRLNKVTRDLNVGITTVVDFLQKKRIYSRGESKYQNY